MIPLKCYNTRFKGDPKHYICSCNLFHTVVHDNPNLRPVVKFTNLKTYLPCEPLTLIINLLLSEVNCRLSLKNLDNRRMIVQSHLDKLWNISKYIYWSCQIYSSFTQHYHRIRGALKNKNYAVDQWDPILLHIFQKKMDCQLWAQWELMVDTYTDLNIEDFTIFLMEFSYVASLGQSRIVN